MEITITEDQVKSIKALHTFINSDSDDKSDIDDDMSTVGDWLNQVANASDVANLLSQDQRSLKRKD